MHVGKSLKIALVKAGKNQSWLAKMLGVTSQHVSNLAQAESVNGATIDKLSKAFEMSSSDFIRLGEE